MSRTIDGFTDSLENVIRQWSRSWDCNRIIHFWFKALELVLAEKDLVWLALPCTTTDLATVLTQRTHSPLYVTGTRSCKWTGLIIPELPGSRSAICNFIYVSTARCHSKLSSSDCTQRRLQQQQKIIDPNQFFLFNDTGYDLRGHSLKLYKPIVRLNVRKQFYSYRVIHSWNQLPQCGRCSNCEYLQEQTR